MADINELMNIYTHTCATLDQKVADFQQKFASQMQCQKGCSSCCENAQFRIRLIEAQSLWTAYQQAPLEIQNSIQENINSPQAGHENDCPLLVNGTCSLYSARPALCRAYGTLVKLKDEVSTCKLNFNQVPDHLKLDVIDIEPFYDVLDELSSRIWQESKTASDNNSSAPAFTIREFFTGKLKD